MNLRQCEVFRAVMEAGSVTLAAERLHVSQPAVSKMLAQLEREIGFRAFLRQRRRLIATPEAQTLYQEVRRAFIGLDHLTRLATDLRDLRRGHLVLAASHAIASAHLPQIVAAFLRAHPGLSVSLQTLDSPSIAQAVATGRVDLGVAQFGVPVPGVRLERLLSVEAVCVMPPGHALARRQVVRARDLHGQPFVALASVNRLRARLDTMLAAAGAVPVIQVGTPLASTACGLVMQGMGVCVLDRLSAEANLHQGIAIRPFRPAIGEDLVLLSSDRAPLSVVATAFSDGLRTAARVLAEPMPIPSRGRPKPPGLLLGAGKRPRSPRPQDVENKAP